MISQVEPAVRGPGVQTRVISGLCAAAKTKIIPERRFALAQTNSDTLIPKEMVDQNSPSHRRENTGWSARSAAGGMGSIWVAFDCGSAQAGCGQADANPISSKSARS